jgi:hypothetical protein
MTSADRSDDQRKLSLLASELTRCALVLAPNHNPQLRNLTCFLIETTPYHSVVIEFKVMWVRLVKYLKF